ncbi:hypothetical protein [Actinoplanes sp. NBRC 101535]|uniref:hypothetical protein n=1 Tax=Actinoplanes sp. NBRC 101535 TaxID=3032196 RepID=UPI0025548421|nr:hypothetical protein [Actinoplanes sp. NBRC 101535]
MLLEVGDSRVLGDAAPRLRFVEDKSAVQGVDEARIEARRVGRRVLAVDDKPAFELSYWCGTCQFLFERLEGATATFSPDDADGLASGISGIDHAVISRFGTLLPEGGYRPLLLEVTPRLVFPSAPGDYFAEDQVATWGPESFWGLPVYPRTPYYRTFETRVDDGAHFYEFVVPMVPPSWNEPDRVAAYTAALGSGVTPTAVAVSILDVCNPAEEHGVDVYAHWALTHFLLDGHHKTQAGAEAGRPIQLLSLLAVDPGLSTPEQVARVPALRAAEEQTRLRPRS